MKKVITLTESELVNLIGRIVEDVDVSQYDKSDIINAFIQLFKPWVTKTHGDELSDYPPSYLVNKYLSEFIDYLKIPEDERDEDDNPYDIGEYILTKGLYSYKNLKQTEKFTEKYKKQLQVLIDGLNLPDYLSIELEENEPYVINATMDVNFLKLVEDKIDPSTKLKPTEYLDDLKGYITNFLSQKIGKSGFGELEFYVSVPNTNDSVNEWVKNVFNKKIKKRIKELPHAKENLHSIKFSPSLSRLRGTITLVFKAQHWGMPSSKFKSKDFVEDVKNLLNDMGYNENLLKVYY